jgi:hypothetical protein
MNRVRAIYMASWFSPALLTSAFVAEIVAHSVVRNVSRVNGCGDLAPPAVLPPTAVHAAQVGVGLAIAGVLLAAFIAVVTPLQITPKVPRGTSRLTVFNAMVFALGLLVLAFSLGTWGGGLGHSPACLPA